MAAGRVLSLQARSRQAVVTIFVATAFLAINPALAHAGGYCYPSGSPYLNGYTARDPGDYPHNNYLGWQKFVGFSLGATTANMLVMNPWVNAVSSVDFSTSWVMLANTANTPAQYAQVGWYTNPAVSYDWTFVEIGTNGGSHQDWTFGTINPGPTATFTVAYLYSPGNFDFWAGGSHMAKNAPFVPDTAQQMSEVVTRASQMAGGTQDGGEQFTHAQYWAGQPGTGIGSWYPFNVPANQLISSNGNWWGAGTDGSQHMWSWDWDCSHN